MAETDVRVIRLKSGKIAVVTHYHPLLVQEIKEHLIGKWISLGLPNGEKVDAWEIDPMHEGRVRALVEALWPPKETLVERVYRFTTTQPAHTSPTIDGWYLISIGREWFSFKSDQVLEVLKKDVETGGVRRNPYWEGTITVRVRCRPQAKAEWNEGTIEDLTETTPPTPETTTPETTTLTKAQFFRLLEDRWEREDSFEPVAVVTVTNRVLGFDEAMHAWGAEWQRGAESRGSGE